MLQLHLSDRQFICQGASYIRDLTVYDIFIKSASVDIKVWHQHSETFSITWWQFSYGTIARTQHFFFKLHCSLSSWIERIITCYSCYYCTHYDLSINHIPEGHRYRRIKGWIITGDVSTHINHHRCLYSRCIRLQVVTPRLYKLDRSWVLKCLKLSICSIS